MATAKVTAMELRQGDEVMIYLYNSRGACARIITLKNVDDKIEIEDNAYSSKMPIEEKFNESLMYKKDG